MPDISKDEFIKQIGKYFPTEALDYVFFYFNQYRFSFRVSADRVTKKGDFKYFKDKTKIPIISVNGSLCTYDFLLVYIHELAHYIVYEHYDIFKVKSHGEEWKDAYRKLLTNLIENVALPYDIMEAFESYIHRIKSSTSQDEALEKVLDRYRKLPESVTRLKDLQIGDYFVCRNELFRLDSFARTRAKCTLMRANRKYLISGMMNVEKVNNA